MGKQYPAICANDLHAIQNLVPPANEAFSCLPAAGADQQQGSGTSEIQVYSHPPPSSVPQGRKTYTDPATTEHRCATNPPPRPPTTTPPPTPPTKPFRKAPWIISGLAVYSFTAYGFYLYRIYNRQVAASQHLQVPDNVLDRYERTARDYDSEVELAERAMWMGRLRKRLTKRAYGDVLEVSVGTGRNAAYYDLAKCRSVTMLDQSGEMVEIARGKFRDLHPHYPNTTFLTQPAESPIPSPPANGYDTILQTMGLCSTPNPTALLRHLGTLANQEHSQILLPEHGKSHYAWLNRVLDNLAPHHADRYGCWWNRDIGRIVEESGLEVLMVKRYYLGTTWWVELRPRSGGSKEKC